MALHAAEEETIEALKKWWDDNGTAIITLVAVAALSWGGWTFWQNSREATISAASDIYEEILALASTDPGATVSEADRSRILSLAEQLQTDHGDSSYAHFAALFAAQQAVNSNRLEVAEQQLNWVLDNADSGFFGNTDQGLVLTATLYLGRVLLAQGNAEQALALVDSVDPGTFEAQFAELRGDIYVSLGRPVDARDAYTTALQSSSGANTFLQMKLDELSNES